MADLYGQVVRGDGVGSYTVGANTRKVIRNKFEYGTPDLRLLMIVDDASTGSFTTGHADSNSQLSKAVIALQQRVEIYGVSNTDTDEFAVYVRRSSIPLAAGEEDGDLEERTILSAALSAATGLTIKVYDGEIDGEDIDYD